MGLSTAFRNTRSFFGNLSGGLRGPSSMAAWGVAGGLAYFLWVRPEQQARKEQEAKSALLAESRGYVDKSKPIADPQVGGLRYGKSAKGDKN